MRTTWETRADAGRRADVVAQCSVLLIKESVASKTSEKAENSAVDSAISKKIAARSADGEATGSAPSMDIPADPEPDVANTTQTALLKHLLKLCMPSIYWSSHRILNHERVVYCKLNMRKNDNLVYTRQQ